MIIGPELASGPIFFHTVTEQTSSLTVFVCIRRWVLITEACFDGSLIVYHPFASLSVTL